MKKAVISLFVLFCLASLVLAGLEENVACAFVYVLFAMLSGVLAVYFTFGKIRIR